jgi:hypothetical protein
MAYKATSEPQQKWIDRIDKQAVTLKQQAQQQRDFAAAGQLMPEMIIRFFDVLIQTNNLITTAAAVSGLSGYIKAEKRDEMADPIAEIQAMQKAATDCADWIRTNYPDKAPYSFPVGNETPAAPNFFTASQTVGYRSLLDNIIATVS